MKRTTPTTRPNGLAPGALMSMDSFRAVGASPRTFRPARQPTDSHTRAQALGQNDVRATNPGGKITPAPHVTGLAPGALTRIKEPGGRFRRAQ